jgi:DUF438 domain-containing protein
MALSKIVKRYLSELGRRGGKVSSPAKTAAVRANAKKPRPGARKKKEEAK